MKLSEEALRQHERYLAAAHAMQTGVAYQMEFDPSETNPKHLRTGINSAMVEHGALVGLLIEKGLMTYEEYFKALADNMEREVESYRRKLEERLGKSVTLR